MFKALLFHQALYKHEQTMVTKFHQNIKWEVYSLKSTIPTDVDKQLCAVFSIHYNSVVLETWVKNFNIAKLYILYHDL